MSKEQLRMTAATLRADPPAGEPERALHLAICAYLDGCADFEVDRPKALSRFCAVTALGVVALSNCYADDTPPERAIGASVGTIADMVDVIQSQYLQARLSAAVN